MLRERRRRRGDETPRRQEQTWRSWLRVEYLLFLITLLAAMALTLSFALGLWSSGSQQRQDKKESAANQQDYVTYFRHVVDEDGSTDTADGSAESSAEPEPKTEMRLLLDVDIHQFEDQEGLAGEVYATLLEKYPKEVETILSWYEEASLEEKGEWTTVGEAYPEQAVPERLLKLILSNEETIPVVAQYPYRSRENPEIELLSELDKPNVPLLLQWDPRWAFEPYGDGLLCYTGCGPTCLAMVALHLNQDSSITPVSVAQYADREGYYTDGVGSAWTLMSEGSWHFGLTASEVSVTEERMREKLEEGKPLIAAVGAGDFTENGHFIVISGYHNGSFVVNDPNSRILSERTWTFDQLSGQIKVIWAFSRSGEG